MPADESLSPSDEDAPPQKPLDAEISGQQPVIDSDSLFQGAQELLIYHNDQIYRLRQTRNGKLILNK